MSVQPLSKDVEQGEKVGLKAEPETASSSMLDPLVEVTGPEASPLPSMGARLEAAKEHVNGSHFLLSWMLPLMLAAEMMMFLAFAMLAWSTKRFVILPTLLLRVGLAACRDGVRAIWHDPARVGFASRHSAFGLHPKQSGACLQNLAALIFTLLLLIFT